MNRNHPCNELDQEVEQCLAGNPGTFSVLVHRLSGSDFHYERLADRVVPSASLIKILIMVEVFQQSTEGLLSLSERLEASPSKMVPFGLLPLLREPAYSIWDLLVYMMTLSDNTAANLLIDRLGMTCVNALADRHGLPQTRLRRKMMDFQARLENRENETSLADMARLMTLLHRDAVDSPESCASMRGIMMTECSAAGLRRCAPSSWPMLRKTGELEGIRHDLCVLYAPEGTLLMGVFSTGLHHEHEAEELTVALGRLMIKYGLG